MEWISVKDELPKKGSKVTYKMANDKIDFGGFDGKDFWTFDPTSISEVTHWKYI
jgi:hypothetical protein